MDNFKWSLKAIENNTEYNYFVDEEDADENANTKLYKGSELISNNFLASNDLMETLEKIFNGEITEYEMSETMRYNYKCMIENEAFTKKIELKTK